MSFFGDIAGISGLVSIGLDIFGLTNDVSAQDQQREALQTQGHYEASIDRLNAMLRRNAANDALARGIIVSRQHRREVDQLIGEQRATLAANGVDVTTGTAVALASGTAMVGAYESRVMLHNAERDAYGLRLEAESYDRLANLAEMRGNVPDTTTSTILTGASQIVSNFASLSAQGVFS